MNAKTKLLKALDSVAGPVACAALPRRQTAVEPRAIQDIEGPVLVIRPGGIGDAVMALPMLHALRTAIPGRRADIVCETRNAAVFKLAGFGDNLLLYDAAPRSTIRSLRQGKYAAALDTEQYHNFSAFMAALTRAPLRVGFSTRPSRNALYTRLVPYSASAQEDTQFGNILFAAARGRVPTLPPRAGLLAGAAALPPLPADAAGFINAKTLLVHAGGSIPSKRCPARVLAEGCASAAAEFGLDIVVIGAKEDAPYAADVARQAGKNIRNICGTLSLAETAAACRISAALVGPDTGIAHLAVALGTPAAVVFGPSDPAKWGPPPGAGVAITSGVACSPCSIYGYQKPCSSFECVCGISAERLAAALRTALGGSGVQPQKAI